MIVPQFWSEARLHQDRSPGRRQVTVRRFGWSETSQADAERMANERAQEVFRLVVGGENLARREPKVGYNGAVGVPIREEILARHGTAVITRNSYGAHCLNTPDVLFADVDFAARLGGRVVLTYACVLLAGALGLGVWLRSGTVGVGAGLLALLLAHPLATALRKAFVRGCGGPEQCARARIAAFVAQNPEWHLRLYRTPAGFRLLALHRTFDARDPAVTRYFTELGADPVYAAMCHHQQCFRARVSPKPWRIGLGEHMRPRPGVWPVNPARLPDRQAWVRRYEAAAAPFASCRYVETLGRGAVHPAAEAVRELHDRLSRALDDLKIA